MKKSIPSMLAVTAVLLVGCSDTPPEANEATCTGDTYQQALSEIRSEVKRKAFIAECESFHKARQMREWEFKPSRKCSWSTAGKVCED